MNFTDEKFADIQMLRYRLNGFESLTPRQRIYIYYLSKATLAGRDITTDQFCKHNLLVRCTLEAIYQHYEGNRECEEFQAFTVYLKRVWFANGIHHHYNYTKFVPGFSEEYFISLLHATAEEHLPMQRETLLSTLLPIMYGPDVCPRRVSKAEGEDHVLGSSCNYYEGVTQTEAEAYYAAKRLPGTDCQPSWGLNSRLVKQTDGTLKEEVWYVGGMYGKALRRITRYLRQASEYAETEQQKNVINLLVEYYQTGDLNSFDKYSIEWLKSTDGQIDFINGFIEVYGDPLGLKASWEGIVEYKDPVASHRTEIISQNAQWFEDHSPVNADFKKKEVRGVSASAICAAMLGGDEYPSTAIGINLPNADWIRARHGSKSVTIGNIIEAYNEASRGSGLLQEFSDGPETVELVRRYADQTDILHTDLHECLGHGSGQLRPGVRADALKAYADIIEEARADLFGLYYMADQKLVELGLLPDMEAYKAQYYSYMMNGLLTQLARIPLGGQIEEAHMRNRALITRWILEHAEGAVTMERLNGKTTVSINNYEALRPLFAQLLAEVQRMKSEGDYEKAKELVERYGVKIDSALHQEVHERYSKLNISQYKGFINPRLLPVIDPNSGSIQDVEADYTEAYDHQMLRYSEEYDLEDTLGDTLRQIKQSFRLEMNGVVAQSMRDKGIGYKLNWGIPLHRLKPMAAEYKPSAPLARALMQDRVRECKLLGLLLMPPAEMDCHEATLMARSLPTQEIAEHAALLMFQNIVGIEKEALEWLKEDNLFTRICGLHVVGHKLRDGMQLTAEQTDSFVKDAFRALQSNHTGLAHTALNVLQHLAQTCEENEKRVVEAAKNTQFEFFFI